MSFSIQTNVNSLVAQENLRVNGNFQSLTITRLTSGYRINSSGDDAAGLAIANKYRSDVAELGQGVRNANDGISTLQIIDGGMNNVGKMLDRLRTLAAQSSSATFTDSGRVVANQEFQSLLKEIDRQAQSIGLDTNGQFAKSLAVFIGGGKAATTGNISTVNGTVDVDLTASAVDARSLGLKGLQVVGGSADISNSSTTHTVAQILADDTNKITQTPGFSDMFFAGPGFSDGSKVKVAINLNGVADINGLVTAVNTAIQQAGNGVSQAATAFKAAGITASVLTDGNGQHLAFTSSNTAFQVEAGDRMANAFLGRLTGSNKTGDAMAATVQGTATGAAGAASFDPTNVTLRISGGGMTSPKDITFASTSTDLANAILELTAKVAADTDLKAAGITVSGSATNPLVFSNARGEKFSVEVTGDTANKLGFGSFVSNTSSGNAVDYTSISGSNNYTPSSTYGTAHLEFSINGAQSSTAATGVDIDLSAGDATKSILTAANAVNVQGNSMTIGVDGAGPVTINFTAEVAAKVTAASGNADVRGKSLDITLGGVTKTVTFADQTGASVTATAGFAVGGTLTYNTGAGGTNGDVSITIDAPAKAATGAVFTAAGADYSTLSGKTFDWNVGGGNSGSVTLTGANDVNKVAAAIIGNAAANAWLDIDVVGGNLIVKSKNLGNNAMVLGSNDAAFNTVLTTGGNTVAGQNAGAITAQDVAASITRQAGTNLDATVDGTGNLVITSKAKGTANTMTITSWAGLTHGAIGAGTDGDNDLTKVRAAIVAQDGRVTATNPSGNNIVITDATARDGTQHTLTIADHSGSNAATLLGYTAGNANLTGTTTVGSDTAEQQAVIITNAGAGVTASVDRTGKLVIEANAKGGHTINIADGTGTAATALGLAASTNNGVGRSGLSVADAVNTAIAQNTTLQAAGLKASFANSKLTLASTDNTYFRVSVGTSATTADLGFGATAMAATKYVGTTDSNSGLSAIVAGGASGTNSISFAALANGSDDQAINISANDSTGALKSLTITLQNDAAAVRNGRSLDEAINFINTKLQQSSDATLQKIVAVKEQGTGGAAGTERINFISSLGSFKVGLGSSANGKALNSGTADTKGADVVGAGASVSVDSMTNALSAVKALAAAVTMLGTAQAAVGKGQNQLSYAVSLAQSQISSFSAAESRIRDADVAAEAANMTKAQVLQQASIAAMAQANSAPQAVLSLLRG